MPEKKNILRLIGFSLLALLFLAIGFVFYAPEILVGTVGLMFPVALFILLLVAFYLLIISTRT